jgi:hypothetical protein
LWCWNFAQGKQIERLGKSLEDLRVALTGDACGCGGACVVCKLDKVKPLVDTILSTARRAAELTHQLEGIKSLRRLGADLAEITGDTSQHNTGDYGEGDLMRQLEDLRRRHDEALEALCHPTKGLQPSHSLCAGYCAR